MPADRLVRTTQVGLAVALALAGVKLAAGMAGRSSALIADAAESFADTVGSLIVWRALRVAARPPDDRHPYGYGKAEAVAALLVGMLLLVAAAGIVAGAVRELLTPHAAPASWTLLVLVAATIAKEVLFRWIRAAARAERSTAAEADAWHHRSDAITSGAAIVGVTVAVWGPGWFGVPQLVLADEVAALVASGIIVLTAIGLLRPPLRELLDAAPPELAAQIRAEALAVPGVVDVEKVFARLSGRAVLVDMHLHVDGEMTLREAHDLSGRVKARIRSVFPGVAQVLIHVEPAPAARSGEG